MIIYVALAICFGLGMMAEHSRINAILHGQEAEHKKQLDAVMEELKRERALVAKWIGVDHG